MRKHLLWFVLGGAACASSRPVADTGTTTSRTIQVYGVPGKLTVSSASNPVTSRLDFTVDEVWRVLPAVFDSLGVKVSMVDPKRHIIGAEDLKVRVQLGRTPMSRYIDCGQTQIGQNADSYELRLTVLAQVQAVAPGGSLLSTTLDAAAKPITFSQDYSRCSSKGLFESRLVEAVKKALQR